MNYIWNSAEGEVEVLSVVDGETLDVSFRLPFDIAVKRRIRLARVSAPSTKDKSTREAALLAKQTVTDLLAAAKSVKIVTHKAGRYSFYVADVFVDGISLNKLLVEKGVVQEYKHR